MGEIEVFDNGQFGRLRVVRDEGGEPWFVARDITNALELDRTATRRLDDDEKGVRPMHTLGGEQEVLCVTEAGLYNLVLASRKPEARAFKRWVTHEVLPAIRRHGAYATPQTVEQMLADPDTMIATLTALKAERERSAALAEDNARLLPKASMYDVAIEAEGTMTVTQAARYLAQLDRGITMRKLYARLRADELICKQSNAPTRYAIDHGYMVQVMSTRRDGKANAPYARVTRKGLDWCVKHYCVGELVTV